MFHFEFSGRKREQEDEDGDEEEQEEEGKCLCVYVYRDGRETFKRNGKEMRDKLRSQSPAGLSLKA